ncbi:hypothetical protein NKH18_38480 [Streptomyces sp. M10(2022)]
MQEFADDPCDRLRVLERDVRGDGAREFQGAALPGLQAELQDGREGEALGDELPGGAGALAAPGQQGVDSAHHVQVGRDHRGLDGLAVDDVRDEVGGQVVQRDRLVLVDAAGEQERSEKVYERLATYPARWAASWTESLKRSVLSSWRFLSSSPPVNSWVMEAAASAARPVPR